jgi:hypothetical protein
LWGIDPVSKRRLTVAKPYIHALSSVKKYGGRPDEYTPIHEFLDSSKGAIPDNRHRALTHTSWFLSVVLPRVFGETFVNSDGRVVSVRDVGEDHVLEDYGMKFIPTPQDFLAEVPMADWMQNGRGQPPSSRRLYGKGEVRSELFDTD